MKIGDSVGNRSSLGIRPCSIPFLDLFARGRSGRVHQSVEAGKRRKRADHRPGMAVGAVQHSPRRTDEWSSLQILLIPALLADEQDFGFGSSFAKHNLCGVAVKRACRVFRSRPVQNLQVIALGGLAPIASRWASLSVSQQGVRSSQSVKMFEVQVLDRFCPCGRRSLAECLKFLSRRLRAEIS